MIAKPTAEELAHWDAILEAEGLSMSAGVGVFFLQFPTTSPSGEFDFLETVTRQFDYSLRHKIADQMGTERYSKVLSDVHKEIWTDPDFRQRVAVKKAAAFSRPEVKKAISDGVKNSWTDPTSRAKRMAAAAARRVVHLPKVAKPRNKYIAKVCKQCGAEYLKGYKEARYRLCSKTCSDAFKAEVKARQKKRGQSVVCHRNFRLGVVPHQLFPPPILCLPGTGQLYPLHA